MKRSATQLQPLLIEWSRSRVRAFDISTRRSTYGASLAECLQGSHEGREVIIAISQRSVFIRALYVPAASRGVIARVLELQLDQLLPLGPKEYVFGFRLGAEVPGKGRIAVVGAIKTETLRLIYDEAKTNGLRVKAVVPLAFGSWLAARARSLTECAVVDSRDEELNVDVVHDGELWYSRSIAAPETPDEIEDEIARTLKVAEVGTVPTLSHAGSAIGADVVDVVDDKEAIEYLADTQVIGKHLFSLELPEKTQVEGARAQRWIVQRALAAAAVAIGLGVYAYVTRFHGPPKPAAGSTALAAAGKIADSKRAAATSKVAATERANRILDVAFQPGQTFTDMVTVLANSASPKSWFTGLVISRGQPLSISGLALTDSDVSQFITDISTDPRFQEMKVVSASKTTIGVKQVTQFLISGRPIGSVPFDRPPKGGKKT